MKYYIYALIDTSEEVNIETKYGIIKFKPFYIGKGTYTKAKTERCNVHYYDAINNRNINPHKERTIRKLLKTNHYDVTILYESEDVVDDVEIELITLLGKKCNNTGMLTNISDGGDGGHVWKDNPIAMTNIKVAASKRWSGDNNPNSSKNRKLEDTYSHKAAKDGKHWNKGRVRVKYELYDNNLNLLGVYSNEELIDKFSIASSTVSASISKGKKLKSSYFVCKENTNIKLKINTVKKLIDNGIVRAACIIYLNDKYAEIDRNVLSLLKGE